MRFLLDESAEARIALFLTVRGHDATRIGRDYSPGLPDEEVLALAHREQRILITNDKDFGELVVRKHRSHAGVILFRFPWTALLRPRSVRSRISWPPIKRSMRCSS